MARKAIRSYDVTPNPGVVDTVTTTIPGHGDPADIRTYKPARTRVEPLAQMAAPLPIPPGGVESRDGHMPTRADCGDEDFDY